MSSKSLAKTITELERERNRLQRDLDAVNAALSTIARAVNGKVDPRANGRAARANGIGAGKSASKSTRRAWFDRDEAGTLLKKAARKPASPADLVRELARLKGYEGRLAKQELRRFQGAAFMAISQALKIGSLKRQGKSGLLVAA